MQVFRPDGGVYVARVDPTERAVLLEVVDDVIALLSGPGPVRTSADPAVRRLLPDASSDPDAAAELRRLTEQDLRESKTDKLSRLRACIDAAGPELVVLPSEAPAVAAALTDVRLVVAERLGIRTDADSEAVYALVLQDDHTGPGGADHADSADTAAGVRLAAAVHVALGMLQESLVELMLAALADRSH